MNCKNNNLKTLSIFVFDQTSIFEVEKSGFTFMALRFCQRNGNVPTCGQKRILTSLQLSSLLIANGLMITVALRSTMESSRTSLSSNCSSCSRAITKFTCVGPYEYLDVRAKWDFTFVDGALWSDSTDYVNFALRLPNALLNLKLT